MGGAVWVMRGSGEACRLELRTIFLHLTVMGNVLGVRVVDALFVSGLGEM